MASELFAAPLVVRTEPRASAQQQQYHQQPQYHPQVFRLSPDCTIRSALTLSVWCLRRQHFFLARRVLLLPFALRHRLTRHRCLQHVLHI